MAKFKVGDRVRYKKENTYSKPKFHRESGFNSYTIKTLERDDDYYLLDLSNPEGICGDISKCSKYTWIAHDSQLEEDESTLESALIIKSRIMTTSIITKFINKNLKEPQKTYRKLLITNENDMLTEDGMKVYLNYLLQKDESFLTDIAAPMLIEEEAESKK